MNNNFDNNIFHNIDRSIGSRSLLNMIKWKLTSKKIKWPKNVPIKDYDIPPSNVIDEKIRISFVGHMTFLIQTEGLNILTDPVWSDRASPFKWAGPARVTPPGIKFDNLPKIDLVLITHNHYDHLDIHTIEKIFKRDHPLFILPLKNDELLKSKFSNIKLKTLNWHEKFDFSTICEVVLEPAQHWSARGIFDKNKNLWGSFILKIGKNTIFFMGDSGYNADLFKTIGETHPNILVSLIPIGAFEPRWFMKEIHMNPEEAVLAHKDLKSQYSIATHFETFPLADEGYDQPATQLEQARIANSINKEKFITPRIGQAYWF